MITTTFIEEVAQVFKELHMTALIRGQGNSLYIFFDGRLSNFLYTSVMAKMDNLNSLGLQDPTHDIDGRIMPVE
jgi:hypothetical protein